MDHQDVETKRILQKILCVLKLSNNDVIMKQKESILKSGTKRQIYEMCDGKHTVSELTVELKTTQPNVSYHLSSLLESGLVLYEYLGGKRYYFKSLE